MEDQRQNAGNILYDANDMVKAGCNDCRGCSDCCRGMGDSIILDPYDIWQLEVNLKCTFAELLQEKIELHVEEGLILPHLKMQGKAEQCGFLDENGRCGIHVFRPGLCRLFPLGRNYGEGKLQYFLLQEVCPYAGHTKMKIKKWLAVPELRKYEAFLVTWHGLRRTLQDQLDEARIKEINMQFLHIFYEKQYGPEDFYTQFEERLAAYKSVIVFR
ncbi:MAG: YkgJ family cysteine cluster protein [Roseburia sp.]|nr:YkgJ family cysteine cluster protein [Ruminococcus sp.]MCM1155183.1 YkgJ family cysteine cluster protein [Roseburia sp.]MCM1242643.1 YkgJ family cysteine cluster protein [Roseburia sp.]